MQDIFLGRQPIYDRGLHVVAYELLFRDGRDNNARHVDGDQATSQVIVNAFIQFGLTRIIGPHRAFINLTRGFLVGDLPFSLSPETVVLEVLEDIDVDEELLSAVARLRKHGHTIALDDFVLDDRFRPLLEHANIIKIDVMSLSKQQIADHVQELRSYPVKLLAEKIETQQEYAYCRHLGFDLFQGYFLARPKVIKGKQIPPNRLAMLQLFARLQDPDSDAAELEAMIAQDVGLSYNLLRYINSAFFAIPKKVESIRQAVVFLGYNAIKTWVTLLAISGMEDKPHALVTTAMLRAKMCELIAFKAGKKCSDTCFLVGLFSALDVLMDVPLAVILQSLPFTEEIRDALLGYEGTCGRALRCALAYEQAHWESVRYESLSPAEITTAYLDAVRWADETSHAIRTSS